MSCIGREGWGQGGEPALANAYGLPSLNSAIGNSEKRSFRRPLYPPSPTPSPSSAAHLHRNLFLGVPPVQGGCFLEILVASM